MNAEIPISSSISRRRICLKDGVINLTGHVGQN